MIFYIHRPSLQERGAEHRLHKENASWDPGGARGGPQLVTPVWPAGLAGIRFIGIAGEGPTNLALQGNDNSGTNCPTYLSGHPCCAPRNNGPKGVFIRVGWPKAWYGEIIHKAQQRSQLFAIRYSESQSISIHFPRLSIHPIYFPPSPIRPYFLQNGCY